MKNRLKNILILALFFLCAGGVLLHIGIHSPAKHSYGFVPLVSGIISLSLPFLFSFRKTLHLAYILNGFTAIIGTITMINFSLEKIPIFSDVFIVWGKFLIGYVIFNLTVFDVEGPAIKPKGLMYFRYPNMGFWFVHLITLSLVYLLGNLIWR
jgi:hypothetical protein